MNLPLYINLPDTIEANIELLSKVLIKHLSNSDKLKDKKFDIKIISKELDVNHIRNNVSFNSVINLLYSLLNNFMSYNE